MVHFPSFPYPFLSFVVTRFFFVVSSNFVIIVQSELRERLPFISPSALPSLPFPYLFPPSPSLPFRSLPLEVGPLC